MWFIILNSLIAISLGNTVPLPSPRPSELPISGADRLWSQAIEEFSAKWYDFAARDFQEFLEKNSSDARALDAHFYLGQSLFHQDAFIDAIRELRLFVETAGVKPERKEGRLYLVRSYLGAGLFSEALLATQDFARSLGEESSSDRARVVLYSAQAQIGLKQNLEAEKNLTAFFAAALDLPDLGDELTQAALVRVKLKSNECDRFPSSSALTEDQSIDQMKRKSLCTIEIASLLNTIGKNPEKKSIEKGLSVLQENLRSLQNMSREPPLGKGKRTPKEWERAKTELGLKLDQEWTSSLELVFEILKPREILRKDLDTLREIFQKSNVAKPSEKEVTKK
jgi:tetratricopeptide (TPR) repeat protein